MMYNKSTVGRKRGKNPKESTNGGKATDDSACHPVCVFYGEALVWWAETTTMGQHEGGSEWRSDEEGGRKGGAIKERDTMAETVSSESKQHGQAGNMDRFLGKWEVTSTENMDNMLQAIGKFVFCTIIMNSSTMIYCLLWHYFYILSISSHLSAHHTTNFENLSQSLSPSIKLCQCHCVF